MESSILADFAYYHLISQMESLMGSGGKICMGPYGLKTTKARTTELNASSIKTGRCKPYALLVQKRQGRVSV